MHSKPVSEKENHPDTLCWLSFWLRKESNSKWTRRFICTIGNNCNRNMYDPFIGKDLVEILSN